MKIRLLTDQREVYPLPLPSGSIEIKDLAVKSGQVSGFKGLIGKVFINHRLSLPSNARNGFGAASRIVRFEWTGLEIAPIRL